MLVSRERLVQRVMDIIVKDTASYPTPLHVYPASDTEKAVRYMQSGKNTGRTAISLSYDDIVPKLITKKSLWQCDANASYLIAGGLGGLGRAIIRWMASSGAKHLIIPSRSEVSSPNAMQALSELKGHGLNIVAPMCDVGSATQLADLLQECAVGDIKPFYSDDLTAILYYYCDPTSVASSAHSRDPDKCQLLVGAVTPVNARPGSWRHFEYSPLSIGFTVATTQIQRHSTSITGQKAREEDSPSMLFRHAENDNARAAVAVTRLVKRVARALSVSEYDADPLKPLSEYGVDSLMAVELRNWIRRDFDSAVAVFDIMGGCSSIAAAGKMVVEKCL
ncbi:hypothetical protein QQS21_001966 [Conoideocrella luteorostrata]|uniref:Carrier domain-containing protein n=1 Tax=Conoideocrella luteorostrata TaxID=1105319 RepID=A0AAJ0G360_9HYPO|nr:hypothetical protein QQS21_001966 [Conoideocrella luteorostrata]